MTDSPKRNVRKIAMPVVVVLVIAFAAWRWWSSRPDEPANVIVVSGRIEGDESSIASKATGRIREIRFREGDRVEAGDIIATLEDDQLQAREEQAQAALRVAEARVRQARQQIAVLNEQLRGSRISVKQSQVDAQGRVRQAEANLAAAEADLAQAEAAQKMAAFDRDAYTNLAKTGAVSERAARSAQSNAETQSAVVAAARRRVEAAKGALETALANLSNPELKSVEAATLQQQILLAETDVVSAQAEAQRARAQLEEAQANRHDLVVRAPFGGTIATRSAEPGEIAAPGSTIVTLIDLSRVYLRGYIPEGQIGRVKIGQAARAYLDSAPETPLKAYVSRVDPQAAFTPENTYFRDDRVKQVVGVKLQLQEGSGFAKPGMPADGLILVEGTEWPDVSPRH